MRHVDDALLVAFADDALSQEERIDVEAHLAMCAECRTRVAEERRLAERAAAVLGAGVPESEPEMPAFAEILRRSEESDATSRGGVRGARSRSWALPPLAWAAMLVVGLGAAVIARTLLVSPEFNAPAESRVEGMDVIEDAQAPGTLAAPAESISAAAAQGGAAAAVQSAAPGDAAAAGDAPATVPPAPAAVAERGISAAEETAAAKAAREPKPVQESPLRERPQDAPRVEPSRERERFADMLRRDTAPAAAQAPRAARIEAAPPAPPPPVESEISGAAAAGSVALSGVDVAWRGESLAGARERGVSVAGVPDAPVVSVWLGTGTAAWRARVVQQVDSASLEIIEWRRSPGVAGQSGELGDGRNYLFTEHEGVVFLLRSTLPVERLETLSARIRELQ